MMKYNVHEVKIQAVQQMVKIQCSTDKKVQCKAKIPFIDSLLQVKEVTERLGTRGVQLWMRSAEPL